MKQQIFANTPCKPTFLCLADVSDIFYFFFGSGRGKGESEGAGRGVVDFFIENPTKGGALQEGRGREGVCGKLGIWGGGGG